MGEFITEEDYDTLWQVFDAGELKEKGRYVVSGKLLKYILDQIPRAM